VVADPVTAIGILDALLTATGECRVCGDVNCSERVVFTDTGVMHRPSGVGRDACKSGSSGSSLSTRGREWWRGLNRYSVLCVRQSAVCLRWTLLGIQPRCVVRLAGRKCCVLNSREHRRWVDFEVTTECVCLCQPYSVWMRLPPDSILSVRGIQKTVLGE